VNPYLKVTHLEQMNQDSIYATRLVSIAIHWNTMWWKILS